VVYVPAGAIEAYSEDYFTDFCEMTSGVNELSAGCDARTSVYNMHGMLVKTHASQADIDALAPVSILLEIVKYL